MKSFYGARVLDVPPVPISNLPPLPPRPKRHWRFLARCRSTVPQRRLSSPSLTFFLLLLLVMAGDVELNPGPGSSRGSWSSMSLNEELDFLEAGGLVYHGPNPSRRSPSWPTIASGPAGASTSRLAPDPPPQSPPPHDSFNDTVFNDTVFDVDEPPRCSVWLTKDTQPEVTTAYAISNDVEILAEALEGAQLTPVTGVFVDKFTTNPTDHSLSTYVVRLMDTIKALSCQTVWWFPYVEPKQLQNAIIAGFKV